MKVISKECLWIIHPFIQNLSCDFCGKPQTYDTCGSTLTITSPSIMLWDVMIQSVQSIWGKEMESLKIRLFTKMLVSQKQPTNSFFNDCVVYLSHVTCEERIWKNMPFCKDVLGMYHYPDSKVHRANTGLIWGRQDPGGPHVGPMNFAIWVFMTLQ